MLTSSGAVLHHRDMGDVRIDLNVTIEQATEAWLSRYGSPNTRAAYASDLRSFLAWHGGAAPGIDVTPDALTQFRAERLSAGASTATIDRQFSALRAFFDAACELGLCHDNPFGARRQTLTTESGTGTLTATEVALLRAASTSDPRTDVLVQLLVDEGLRLAEVLALDHADVSGSRHAKRLRVVRHGRATSIELDRSASQSVGALQRSSTDPGPLFTGPGRGRAGSIRLTRFGADHLLKRAAAAAGITRPLSANVLRRTHVTTAQRAGTPIDEIRQRMGHRDVRTTRRYLAPTNTNQPHPERS